MLNIFLDEDEGELLKRFNNRRETFPSMVITTPYDLRGNAKVSEASSEELDKRYKLISHCTRDSPSNVLLYRIKQIATAAFNNVQSNINCVSFDFKVSLFFMHFILDLMGSFFCNFFTILSYYKKN